MGDDRSECRRGSRDVEAVALAALIDAYPDELTEAELRRELTAVENTHERMAAFPVPSRG